MNERNWQMFVEDILKNIDKIERYIKDLDFKSFSENDLVIDGVLRNLEVIGEAARNIPPWIKEQHSQIPWKRMIGLRNIAIHDYFEVDLQIIWEIITRNLPQTKPEIKKLLESAG